MQTKFISLSLLFWSFLLTTVNAQIVTLDPVFATIDDEVTITYDASQGTGQLVGVDPVFMHSGVVTVAGGEGNWQYVQGNWGVYDEPGLMTNIGNNLYTKTIKIRDYYNVPAGEEVTHLAFVFRNEDGSLEGKTAAGQDIFIPLYEDTAELLMSVVSPTEEVVISSIGSTIPIKVNVSQASDIQITEDGTILAQTSSPATEFAYDLTVTMGGQHTILLTANNGVATVVDSFTYLINPTVTTAEAPAGTKNGLNRIDDNTVRLQLWAPEKSYVYVIGDFNDWTPSIDYFMNRGSDNATWWIDITGLDPNEEYAYQYFVDGQLRIGDPYSEKVLDPSNDDEITEATYPNLKAYPSGKTTGIVTAFKTQPEDFNWENDNYNRPAKEDLVIYELLMRDFLEDGNYETLLDTLGYLERLGINAIQLMPVNEFEGNDSWGYNPSYHMALDKYYGTPAAFKRLIDECHARGMAVILDVVYNHAFSQSPLAQLYWDPAAFRPTANNPWLNEEAKHPFNVGYDFNHNSPATKAWLDQVMSYWLEEYHVDGFRFDLSKGFTQNFTNDVGAWSDYDFARVTNLKRIADVLWDLDPDFYVILEHFAAASEERDLANYGMMLWGNGVHEYNEASMGWGSDLSVIDYDVSWRDFNEPNLVGYLESHDEERLMFKNLTYGNEEGDYSVKVLNTALDRQELAGAFFFTMPGPKMFWQFAEMGYGYSINRCVDGSISEDCRLSRKPIRWDYLANPNRVDVYKTWSALIHLKTDNEVFKTTDYNYSLSGKLKRINLNDPAMKVTVIGNFDVVSGSIDPQFQQTGWWYDYMTGDSLNVTDVNLPIALAPGEYRVYLTEQQTPPAVSTTELVGVNQFDLFPNPSTGDLTIQLDLATAEQCDLALYDLSGKIVQQLYRGKTDKLYLQNDFEAALAPGMYVIKLKTSRGVLTQKWMVY